MKSDFHSRNQQVGRAFDIDRDGKDACQCPICPSNHAKSFNDKWRFLTHMNEEHADLIEMGIEAEDN